MPLPTFDSKGVIAPTKDEVLQSVLSEINAAFGGGLSTNLETPQGQLATSLAAILSDATDQFLLLFNSIDPAFADGRMQDAICRLNFITRKPAEKTKVVATLSGLTGAVIPEKSLALASDGQIYESIQPVTIPSSGNIDVVFQCLNDGPIGCPAGTLSTIYKFVPGWDSVANALDGIIGSDMETRESLEMRRQASVSQNAAGYNAAMRGAVLNVPGVSDCVVVDNATSSTQVIKGVSITAGRLYVAVVGGSDEAVAKAIWAKKAPGVPWFTAANTTVNVVDDSAGFAPPYPTYVIKFNRPDPLNVFFKVRLANSPAIPSNAGELIKAAIKTTFKASIGDTVFASAFYAAVANLGSWAQILGIQCGASLGAINQDTLESTMSQIPVAPTDDRIVLELVG